MTTKNVLLLLILLPFVFSCTKEKLEVVLEVVPIPDFTIEEEFYAIGEDVQLRNESVGLLYLWDFGNGQTSTDRDPKPIIYFEPGVYTIKLTTTYHVNSTLEERTVEKKIRVGRYYAYEVQLLGYTDGYRMTPGGGPEGRSEGNPDVYFKVYSMEEEFFKSEVRPGVTRADLPLSWTLGKIPLNACKQCSPIMEFYDYKAGKEDRVIARSRVAGGHKFRDMFDKERNEGEYAYYNLNHYSSHVVVKYRIELP